MNTMDQVEPRLRTTRHARTRMRQRAVDEDLAQLALRYGMVLRHGGDEMYILTDRSLAGTPHECDADRLRGLCVVLTPDGYVRTIMWRHRTRHRPGLLRRSRRLAEKRWHASSVGLAPEAEGG